MRVSAALPSVVALPGRRPISPALRLALAVTGFVLTIMATPALELSAARQHMVHGAEELQLATSMFRSPSTLHTPSLRAEARDRLIEAQRAFANAREDLRPWSPWLSHLGWVPVVGDQLSSAVPAADAAFYSTGAALHIVDGLAPVWPTASARTTSSRLALLADALQAGHAQFVSARADADRAALALRLLPVRSGNSSLDRAGSRLRRDLPRLRAAGIWLALAPTLLGVRQPSHYLLAWQNPAELRATGGFIGASDFITVQRGAWTHRFAGRVPPPREIDSVFLPLPEAMYTPESYWIFCDSNWSPDFPLSARLERWFYGEDTGRWADGVIDFVDTATPDILRATGPVYLPGYRRWVDARNVETLAQQYVNGAYKGPDQRGPQDTVRKQFFIAVMTALQRRVEALPLDRWPSLAAALMQAIAHRDILLYDRRPEVERAIIAAGADGRIHRGPGDLLYVVDDNRSYNKLNPYVHESAALSVAISPTSWLHETLTLRYHVDPSPATLEGYGPDVGQWGTKHDYQDFLRVYVPRGARLEGISGLDAWAPAQAYGLSQFAGRLLIRQGRSAVVIIRYAVPPTAAAQRYHLTVQRQPGAHLSGLTVTVRGLNGVTLAGPGHRQVLRRTVSPSPERDAVLDVPVRGRRDFRPVALPPAPSEPDPYIPFLSFGDLRHPL